LATLVASAVVMTTACDDRRAPETVGRKIDRTAETVAAATDRAAAKVAVAVDDAAITTKVKSAVFAEPDLKSLQIGVDTKDGVVTLSGAVDTPAMRERAMKIARDVEGVRAVVDKLAIKTTG
jgi:hyperosmotically inducible protein